RLLRVEVEDGVVLRAPEPPTVEAREAGSIGIGREELRAFAPLLEALRREARVEVHQRLRLIREERVLLVRRGLRDARAGLLLRERRRSRLLLEADRLPDQLAGRSEVHVVEAEETDDAVHLHLGLQAPLVVREAFLLAADALADVGLRRDGGLLGRR